jgi:hypothetical protein
MRPDVLQPDAHRIQSSEGTRGLASIDCAVFFREIDEKGPFPDAVVGEARLLRKAIRIAIATFGMITRLKNDEND